MLVELKVKENDTQFLPNSSNLQYYIVLTHGKVRGNLHFQFLRYDSSKNEQNQVSVVALGISQMNFCYLWACGAYWIWGCLTSDRCRMLFNEENKLLTVGFLMKNNILQVIGLQTACSWVDLSIFIPSTVTQLGVFIDTNEKNSDKKASPQCVRPFQALG